MQTKLFLAALCLAFPASFAVASTPVPTGVATAERLAASTVDRADDLIQQGREQLRKQNAKAAKELFDQAAAVAGGEARAEIWQLRVAMELEAMNDVLKRIDKLAERSDDPGVDYLFGMAFAVKAQRALDAGLTDGTIGMQMSDAQANLERAVKQGGERFSDAYPMLAYVAWMNSDLDVAIDAADKAIGYFPESATSWGRRGMIQESRYTVLRNAAGEDEAKLIAADEVGQDAARCFDKALKFLGELKPDDLRVTERAKYWQHLAYTQYYLAEEAAMRDAYANGLAWDPSIFDLGAMWNALGAQFVPTLEKAESMFVDRWGTETAADATMLWYLGYARYNLLQGNKQEFSEDPKVIADFDKAAAELKQSVEKWQPYANGLWYAALAQYATGDFSGAAKTMVDFWQMDPTGTVATFDADKERSWPRVEYIIGQLVQQGDALMAAQLAEICANTLKPAGIHWSYKGLFLRDHADAIVRSDASKATDEDVVAMYEESLDAYERALKLEPENPNFMNDLAVVLHYNLHRDLERALELYTEAEVHAKRLMADPEVSEQDKKDFISIALRDSGNNKRLLKKQLEAAKKKKESEDKPE